MGDFLTAEDDGELERRVHKERRKRITEKFSKQLMWEVESINAKIAAGISVGDACQSKRYTRCSDGSY